MAHGNVLVISGKADWEKQHSEAAGKVVIVDFTATWCGPCKVIAPVFADLSVKYPQVVFLKVDVDENEDIARECSITAMPTFKVFQGGKIVDELVGASKGGLEELVAKHAQVAAA